MLSKTNRWKVVANHSLLSWLSARRLGVIVLAAVLAGTGCDLLFGQVSEDDSDAIRVNPSELQWKDGPPSLPDGAEIVVLAGTPGGGGPFVFRLRFPADYAVAAHMHPTDANVTVISGTFHVGVGDELDRSQGKALTTGGFTLLPEGVEHYIWTSEPTVVQVHSDDTWGITYVDPANDPRNE